MVLEQQTGAGRAMAAMANVHPDMGRVLGIAGALAFNLVLLMMLMAQVGPPAGYQPPKYEMVVVPIHVDVPKPPLPTTPVVPPRQTVPVQPRVAPPVHVATPTPAHDTSPLQVSNALANDPDDFVVPTSNPLQTTTPASSGPVQGMHLEYASAPPPTYPRAAQMDGATGTVMLEVLVGVDGTPLQASIHTSSGNRQLDRAARDQVLHHWRFRPAMRDGVPVQAIGLVPIAFTLN